MGFKFQNGDSLGALEGVKVAADLFTPIKGSIIELNKDVTSNNFL